MLFWCLDKNWSKHISAMLGGTTHAGDHFIGKTSKTYCPCICIQSTKISIDDFFCHAKTGWDNVSSFLFSWYGCFRKWWYPQIIQFNRVFHYKPSILGYHFFWKHPYMYTYSILDIGEQDTEHKALPAKPQGLNSVLFQRTNDATLMFQIFLLLLMVQKSG